MMRAAHHAARWRQLLIGGFAAAAIGGLPSWAWCAEPELPGDLVTAPKIKAALQPKDITLDRPGAVPPEAAIDLQVQFRFGSAELQPAGRRQLDELAVALRDPELARASYLLAGHTDGVGDPGFNWQLSRERADAVKRYLAEAHGVPVAHLQACGYGSSRLLDAQHPEAGINRRVEVRRLAGRGSAPAKPDAAAPAPALDPHLVPTPK